jgi:hypothetical protein
MTTKNKTKKTYKKPEVTQVKLEIGEAVLQACKTAPGDTSGKGTGSKDCGHPGCQAYTSIS